MRLVRWHEQLVFVFQAERLKIDEQAMFKPFGLENKNELRSEEHTSELQSPDHLVFRLLLGKQKARFTGHPARRHLRTGGARWRRGAGRPRTRWRRAPCT